MEIYRQNAPAQKRDPHFVRACAVDMHLEISQVRATSYGNLQEKCSGPERAQNAETHFVRACAVEMEMSQEPLHTETTRKNGRAQSEPRTQTHILCEPAQSKCTWTFHKRHYTEIYSRRPRASMVRACAIEMHVEISQEPLYQEIYRENAGAQMEHPDQTPAFTLTARTLSVGTLFGEFFCCFKPHICWSNRRHCRFNPQICCFNP